MSKANAEDYIPLTKGPAVTRPGDVWQLGRHRLLCGDARDRKAFCEVMGEGRADLLFSDPPYNVPVIGHVTRLGLHPDFSMAAGEMSSSAFTAFLETTLGNAAGHCRDGAIAYVFMDWRHMGELLEAGHNVFHELKNLCVWNKSNAGMGSFYRSKHELVFVFKVGKGPHINNFGLGETGRHRANVWDYARVNAGIAGRSEQLQMHPTLKPVALVKDALIDCSKRNGVVLDCFGGAGTTLIAAEVSGRVARMIECDPLYCDTTVRRYEALTGKAAQLEFSGDGFELVAEQRLNMADA